MLTEVRDEQEGVILEVEVALMVGEEVLEEEVGVMGATMVEGLGREVVEVSGTIRWASLVEALTEEVGEDVEVLVEIWEALEVIEVSEVDWRSRGSWWWWARVWPSVDGFRRIRRSLWIS